MDAKSQLKAKLKELQEKHRLQKSLYDTAVSESLNKQREVNVHLQSLRGTVREIQALENAMDNPEVPVTNHAVMRYAERKHGIKLEGIEEELKNLVKDQGISTQVAILGDGKYPGREFTFVVRDGVVVTIY